MSEIRGDGGRAAVIGGGPAGLMAAEVLALGGVAVDVYDAMPSVGRKFLMAGKSGLNLTHAEPCAAFVARYGGQRDWVEPWLTEFGADALREWAAGLGIHTFVGSSGRVFPSPARRPPRSQDQLAAPHGGTHATLARPGGGMTAAPLLRAWLHRLRAAGVRFHMRHRWLGWDADGALCFATPAGEVKVPQASSASVCAREGDADTRRRVVGAGDTATVLALGGGSWARLGSDGAWMPWLAARGVAVAPLRPANCGFEVQWSDHFREKFAGQPVKSVAATFAGQRRQGEFVVSEHGVEGSLIYALAAPLRDAIEREGSATLVIDLAPGRTEQRLTAEIAHPRGSRSMGSHLQSRAGVSGVKAGLLRECAAKQDYEDPARLAAAIKALPLRLIATRPLDEAISSAGGVTREALDDHLMLRALPGVFCAGEMLDWEAPTGGYLLTACFASGYAAGKGALAWLGFTERPRGGSSP